VVTEVLNPILNWQFILNTLYNSADFFLNK
jgi:hypothetical protein